MERIKRTAVVIIGDLSLLTSLYLAYFIVWRTLHVRFRERRARLKTLKLINGSGASIRSEALITVGADEKRSEEVVGKRGFRHR